MYESDKAYQANPLIMAKKGFDVQETRLFYLGLEHVNPHLPNSKFHDREFQEVHIPMGELVKYFGNDAFYTILKDVCKKLFDKKIEIKSGNSWKWYHVFSTMEFKDGEGLYIKFDSEMKPWLLDLFDKGYTQIERKAIWGLSSVHAIRILELVLQYKNTPSKEREITIEELKQYLGISKDDYKGRINNFKKYVLENPIAQINEKTPYKVKYEQVKKGVRIVAFKFKLISEPIDTPMETEQQFPIREELISRGLYANVADKVEQKISNGEWQESMIRALVKRCDAEKPMDSGKWLSGALFKPKSKYQKYGWHIKEWNNSNGQNLPSMNTGMEGIGSIIGRAMGNITNKSDKKPHSDGNTDNIIPQSQKEINDFEIGSIIEAVKSGKDIPKFIAKHMKARGLTAQDVIEGKR